MSNEFQVLHFNSWFSLRNLENVMFLIPSKNRRVGKELGCFVVFFKFICDWEFLCSRKPLPNSQEAQVPLQPSSFCRGSEREGKRAEKKGKIPRKPRARSPCAASAAHQTCEHWTVLLNIMTWGKSHCALTYQQRSKAITGLNTVEEDPIKRNPRKFGENS